MPLLAVVEEAGLDVGWVEDEDVGVVEDVGGEVLLGAEPPVVLLSPGPIFTYASQSGLGAASGHSVAWQREYSCPSMGGAQRTLYRAFRNVLKVLASSSEKPAYLLDMMSWSMKCPRSVWFRFMNLCTYAGAIGMPLSFAFGNSDVSVQP